MEEESESLVRNITLQNTSMSHSYDDNDDDDDDADGHDTQSVVDDDLDDDYDDDDDEDDTDDDNDDDDGRGITIGRGWWSSWIWNELRHSWKQHSIAIVIAIIATYYMQYYNNNNNNVQSTIVRHPPHTILNGFDRTTNITFCNNNDMDIQSSSETTTTTTLSDLRMMDFHVPYDLYDTMRFYYYYYQIDDIVADNNNILLDNNNSAFYKSSRLDTEIQCIQERIERTKHSTNNNNNNNPKDYIVGMTYYYQQPTIQSMYRNTKQVDDNNKLSATGIVSDSNNNNNNNNNNDMIELTFTGFAVKIVNMGPESVLLYWDGNATYRQLVGEIPPYEAITTATVKSSDSFSISPIHDHSTALRRWTVTIDNAIQYYEPNKGRSSHTKQQALSDTDQMKYNMQLLNQEFAKHYQIHTGGRTWLSHFPRAFPIHYMWPAQYFGQRHSVIVKDEQINKHPNRPTEKRYTLEVSSVSPRVFTIEHFLSDIECDTLIQMAIDNGLEASTVYAGGTSNSRTNQTQESRHRQDRMTRSSTNTWLNRDHVHNDNNKYDTNLTDTIYRRAAHILQIDESLMRHRNYNMYEEDEMYDDPRYHSIAESLQVIRYKTGELYAPHHDWVLPSQLNQYQPTRFATLLIYLNDNFDGGHTIFPRAMNTQYHDGIRIQPQKGTAILFYNILPDGNVDDLSQHGSEKVTRGEKFAANLWIWDPVIN